MNYRTIFLSLFIIIGVLGPPKIWGGSNQAWFDTKPNHIYTWYDGFWSIRCHPMAGSTLSTMVSDMNLCNS